MCGCGIVSTKSAPRVREKHVDALFLEETHVWRCTMRIL